MEDSSRGVSSIRKWLPAFAVVAVLALPLGYMALHASAASTSAGSAQAVPAQDAVTAMEHLVQVQPTPSNRLNLSLEYIRANRPAEALAVLRVLQQQEAGNELAWNNSCAAHNMQSEYNLAEADCQRAIQIRPGFQLAYNNLMWARDKMTVARKAIQAAEQLPASSRDSNSYIQEGMNLLHVGDYDRAIAVWQKLSTTEPRNPLPLNDIGVAYMLEQKPKDAAAYFQRAVALDPNFTLARNNLQWAEGEQTRAAAVVK